MPFTPSHAVVAIPFARTALPAAAVACGAMAPDVPLFVPGFPLSYAATHDVRWLPATAVIALVLLVVWRTILRPVLPDLCPRAVAMRLPVSWSRDIRRGWAETFSARGAASPSWGGVALLLAALAIGILSHIAWDAFTHDGRWGSGLFPVLDAQWGIYPGYRWLQYASGVLGLAGIGVWALWWLVRADAAPRTSDVPRGIRIAWWASLPALLVGAAVGWVLWHAPTPSQEALTDLAYLALTPAAAIWVVLSVLLCLGVLAVRGTRSAE